MSAPSGANGYCVVSAPEDVDPLLAAIQMVTISLAANRLVSAYLASQPDALASYNIASPPVDVSDVMYDAGWGETSPTLTAAYVGSTDEDDAMTTCRQVCGDDLAAALLFRWRDREAELLVSTPLFVALAAALVERLERQPELPGPVARSVLIVAQGRHEGLITTKETA